jgi:hypothetical protein
MAFLENNKAANYAVDLPKSVFRAIWMRIIIGLSL